MFAAPYDVPTDWTVDQRLRLLDQLATFGAREPIIRGLAERIGRGMLREERARRLLEFVQLVPYVPEPIGREIFQPALWTLAYGGDCDDKAVLLVALMRAVGERGRVVYIPRPDATLAHYAAQWTDDPTTLDDRAPWVWAETTIPAYLGEHPDDAATRTGRRL